MKLARGWSPVIPRRPHWKIWALGLFVIFCCLLPQLIMHFDADTNGANSYEFVNVEGVNEKFGVVESIDNGRISGIVPPSENSRIYKEHLREDGRDIQNSVSRVGIVMPYIGESLPNWFDTFCLSAAASAHLYDWLIFVTDAPLRPTPSNVKLIRISPDDMMRRILSIDPSVSLDPSAESFEDLKQLLADFSYMLVELKPCFGFMFSDFLREYSHWAYADVDQLVGRLHSIIPAEMLRLYDIVTTSFGDNFRMYLRGQFTVHRNTPYLSTLWRACKHLSSFGARLKEYRASNHKTWHFFSAEGCYARVVADRKDISLFISSSQLSDVVGGNREDKESFLLGNALFRCYGEPILNVGGVRDDSYLVNYADFIEVRDHISSEDQKLSSSSVGSTPLSRNEYNCAYWLPPEFQVCLSQVPSTHDVMMINGHISYSSEDVHMPLRSCREGSTSHFQGWKKNLYHFFGRAPSLNAHALVITDSGFIPLRFPVMHSSGLRGSAGNIQLPSFADLRGSDIPDGRIDPTDIAPVSNSLISDAGRYNIPRLTGEGSDSSKNDQFLDIDHASIYCIWFTLDLKHCQCPLQGKHIHVAQIGEKSTRTFSTEDAVDGQNVTMISVAWAYEFYDKSLDTFLDSWKGPKVVVLAYHDSLPKVSTSHRLDVTLIEVNIGPCYAKMVERGRRKPPNVFPDATMLNIGLDVADTELVAVYPHGLVSAYPKDVRGDNVATFPVATQLRLAQEVHQKSGEEPGPVALVIPVYVPEENADEAHASRDRDRNNSGEIGIVTGDTAHMKSFPPSSGGSKYNCGSQQSKKLMLDHDLRSFELFKYGSSKASKVFNSVDFSAKEFLARNSLALPFVFNQTMGPHGSKFVRFPEELSGMGCHGTSIFRVLAGSGFHLRWAGFHALSVEGVAVGNSDHDPMSCGCINDELESDSETSKEFIYRLNKFFKRAIGLRVTGISGLFTSEPIGKKQEEEQKLLMQKSLGTPKTPSL